MSEKKGTAMRSNYEAWFKGEMMLNRAMLHLKQYFALESPAQRVVDNYDAWMIMLVALGEIVRERAQAGVWGAQ